MENSITVEQRFGYSEIEEPVEGWLLNMRTVIKNDFSALQLYFLSEQGKNMHCTYVYNPYFLVICKENKSLEVEEYLLRTYKKEIIIIEKVYLNDLDMPNHLKGTKRQCLKLIFKNMNQLMQVRKPLLALVKDQKRDEDAMMEFEYFNRDTEMSSEMYITDLREYDITYNQRVCMDLDFRVGKWYNIALSGQHYAITPLDKLLPPEPIVFAYDIETSKEPLKFPDADKDEIMMISYMVDQKGFLITNRSIVSEDIDDFEYSPFSGTGGVFTIYNEPDEHHLLQRFVNHILELKPHIITTYNGDMFDFPYVDTRCKLYNISLTDLFGFEFKNDEVRSHIIIHLDAYKWVKRDSYLPAGSHGLKAVTKAKLGYHPDELDPELMTPYATSNPQILAQYSVSDAVATYVLYMKYVHPFIFSLCNIIPLPPDDVLRKGSGTLCESLLMVQSYKAGVLMPNKHVEPFRKYHNGKLLHSETYTGGHVEALKAGIYRSDFLYDFILNPDRMDSLKSEFKETIKCYVEHELKMSMADIVDFDTQQIPILDQFENLKNNPKFKDNPLIYHLDVGAMYPNIILTNRLQPDAMVTDTDCAQCDFNDPVNNCKRKMTWTWRGEMYPLENEYINSIEHQLNQEMFKEGENSVIYGQLPKQQQTDLLRQRVVELSKKMHNRVYLSEQQDKVAVVCQREHSFYVDTVRNFRDRRYDYKASLKDWKNKLKLAKDEDDLYKIDEASKMVVVMDSLQLAHKCILNSFYGYVMRKGSRWFSMQMGGIVCYTGSKIIQNARQIVDDIGFSLELDTDGIWCVLPKSFPDTITLSTIKGKQVHISIPCAILNYGVFTNFTNNQYQIKHPDGDYSVQCENSIFFEVDGPYKCMILPASTDEDRLLKKRYVVMDHDDQITELKGFEIKRRGELKIIKTYQEIIFKEYLKGTDLLSCYTHIASVSMPFLNILTTNGKGVSDDQIIDLLCEYKSLSKPLVEYGNQKSTSITTAKRLVELLGVQVAQGKSSLACQFIISKYPLNTPIAERAIPIVLFQCSPDIQQHFLHKWFHDNNNYTLSQFLDWTYYFDRFSSVLLKLISIPAILQHVPNPLPAVPLPTWATKVGHKKDMDLNSWLTKGGAQKRTQKHIDTPIKEPSAIAVAPTKIIPNIRTNFLKYIQYQSKSWLSVVNRRDVRHMRHNKQDSKVYTITAIHQVQPGIFDIFTNSTAPIRINMHRTFYSSAADLSTINIDNITVKQVNKKLPMSDDKSTSTCHAITLPESLVSQLLPHMNTNTIYDLHVPLSILVLSKLGNQFELKNGVKLSQASIKNMFRSSNSHKHPLVTPQYVFVDVEMNKLIIVVSIYCRQTNTTTIHSLNMPSQSDTTYNIHYYSDYIALVKSVKHAISTILSNSPAILCLHTSTANPFLPTSNTVLVHKQPRNWSFNSFTWYSEYITQLQRRLTALPDVLEDMQMTSQLLELPLGILSGDTILPLDILMYKYINDHNYVVPNKQMAHMTISNVHKSVDVVPGHYKNILTIQMHNTFINAIFQLQNTTYMSGILRSFLKQELRNEHKDYIIQHIQAHVNNTNSLFYNAEVVGMIKEHDLKIKHFIKMTLMKLGVSIIALEDNALVVSIPRNNENYVQFILDTLRGIQMFKLVEFEISNKCDQMVFMNSGNLITMVGDSMAYTLNEMYYLPLNIRTIVEPMLLKVAWGFMQNNGNLNKELKQDMISTLINIGQDNRLRYTHDASTLLCSRNEFMIIDVIRAVGGIIGILEDSIIDTVLNTLEVNTGGVVGTSRPMGFKLNVVVYCTQCSTRNSLNMNHLIRYYTEDTLSTLITCNGCEGLLDTGLVETGLREKMMGELQREMDIEMNCNLCKNVMMGYITDYCNCTGSYMKKNGKEMKNSSKILQDIASILKLPVLLGEIETWLIR